MMLFLKRFAFYITLPCMALLMIAGSSSAQSPLPDDVQVSIEAIHGQLIEWRRDLHQHPELGNREFRTSKIVADHLKSLGIEIQTEVAHTGVVGLLKGGLPGPVIALRADMDALPVTERNDLPFRSEVVTEYNGQQVGVMHACGHDTHFAILLATASVLAKHKDKIRGTIKFIFQPAEEGPPAGEEGGAELMVKENVMRNPDVDRVYGLHVNSQTDVNTITYRPGGTMASADDFRLVVKGAQAHGAYPWSSIDPIVTSAHIITAAQTIVSRNVNVTENAAVVTFGSIQGGVRSNIIPEEVVMLGTLRALSPEDRRLVHDNFKRIVNNVAEAMGATVEIQLPYTTSYPVTFNDADLVEATLPILRAVAGDENIKLRHPVTGAEDFSFFAREAPGFFFFLGGKPLDVAYEDSPSHHTPEFFIDESGLLLGVKAFVGIVMGS
jgi:amidohydrolase